MARIAQQVAQGVGGISSVYSGDNYAADMGIASVRGAQDAVDIVAIAAYTSVRRTKEFARGIFAFLFGDESLRESEITGENTQEPQTRETQVAAEKRKTKRNHRTRKNSGARGRTYSRTRSFLGAIKRH